MQLEPNEPPVRIADRPLVSVLLPVFNAEPYLEEAMASILGQTYPNIEIIAIDDGSVDLSYRMLLRSAFADVRLKVYRNESNCGIVRTLNRALSLASGNLIARMDADDVAMPDRIEKQLVYLDKDPQVKLVGVSNVSIDAVGNILSRSSSPNNKSEIERTLLLANPISHNWLCYRSVYAHLGGYRDLAPVEDYDFLLRCKSNGIGIMNLEYCGMKIRLTDTGITASSGIRQKLAFNFAIRMYNQRKRNGGCDRFSAEEYRKAIASNRIQTQLYGFASRLNREAIQTKARCLPCAAVMVLASMLISPLQFQYVARRVLLRLCLSVSRRSRVDRLAD